MPIPGVERCDPGGFPAPSTAGTLPTRGGGPGLGRSPSAEPWASQRGRVTTLSQARLTFPRGTKASHLGPATGLPLLPGVALGPRAVSQLPGAARFLGRQLSAHAHFPLGASPRAGSPDPTHTGRKGAHLPTWSPTAIRSPTTPCASWEDPGPSGLPVLCLPLSLSPSSSIPLPCHRDFACAVPSTGGLSHLAV